ncbi:hypothetical protein [Streptomyces aurantiogriseus]|uniref:Uncharacterized protein n=1 Tax=Streptomyces aurantiogriseus TaxID=66870 RepID=A0A918BW69_9ACTN|nr:hypothetical protein [Streptomyces aurantiogriseus]GGQ93759.1 hypothetical protein GCM10010251_05680 [Streptomyces aurantiogriseus]
MPGRSPDDTDALQDPALSRSVLRAAAADPRHLPEILASYAVRHMGPAAARSVTRMRTEHPDAAPAELRALALSRGKRQVVAEGALVGGPLLILAPFAFCAALLSQARICLELAALEGRDPTTPVRGAELMVLQGVYEDVDQARAVLTDLSLTEKGRAGKGRGRVAVLWGLTMRMARVLGLISPGGEATTGGPARWSAQAGRYALLGVVLLVALVAPLVWLPYLGLSYSRSTDHLLDRATAFYSGEPVARPRRTARVEPEMLAAAAKALLSLVIPLGLIFTVILADLRFAGSRWPVLGITLATASCAVAAAWQWRRRRRRP